MSEEIAQAAYDIAYWKQRAERAEAMARTLLGDSAALYEAASEYLVCSCSHGVHWVDVDGEAEAEACDLRIELDDRLRAFDAGEHPGSALLAELTLLRELTGDLIRWREAGGDIRDLRDVFETLDRYMALP